MGVDKSFRARVEEALMDYPSPEQIVLHASHDHDLMLRTCPQAIMVGDCGIQANGDTADVLAKYRSE